MEKPSGELPGFSYIECMSRIAANWRRPVRQLYTHIAWAALALSVCVLVGTANAEFPAFLFSSNVRSVELGLNTYRVTRLDGTVTEWQRTHNMIFSNTGVTYDRTENGWRLRGGSKEYERFWGGWSERSAGLIVARPSFIVIEGVTFRRLGDRMERE